MEPAACGHGTDTATVSPGRCWECHIAHLRAKSKDDRADRLLEIKRLHDEGRFDLEAMEAAMAESLMAAFARVPDDQLPRQACKLRDGRWVG